MILTSFGTCWNEDVPPQPPKVEALLFPRELTAMEGP